MDHFQIGGFDVFQIIGVLGFLLYILPFAAVQWGWLDGNSLSFTLANILAASCVAISLIGAFNLASALIQGSWIVIGLCGLARRLSRARTRNRRFSRFNNAVSQTRFSRMLQSAQAAQAHI